jgi:hypothetical protein
VYVIFNKYQGVPRDAKFITEHQNIDSAFLQVVRELKAAISSFTPIIKESLDPNLSEVSYNCDCDIPPDTLKWVGREKELETLDSPHFKVFFITGLGGQGKSSLASTYVQNKSKFSSEYWDWRDFKEEGHRLKTKLFEIVGRFSDEITLSKIDGGDYSFEAITSYFSPKTEAQLHR